MTKEQALYDFFSSFGYPAYKETAVPTGANFPYITYQVVTGSFDEAVSFTASIWDRNSDGYPAGKKNDEKAQEISEKIGREGEFVDFGDNCIWIQRGTPFAQEMGDPSDPFIRRKILNFQAEFWSAN